MIWMLTTLLVNPGWSVERPKNLKVLKFQTIPEVKKYMKGIAKDLGVKCKFCHDLNDKSIDTDHKRIARSMMRLVEDLNTNFFNWEDAPQITCWTCHRGEKEPQTVRP
jgi:hypothetical protein